MMKPVSRLLYWGKDFAFIEVSTLINWKQFRCSESREFCVSTKQGTSEGGGQAEKGREGGGWADSKKLAFLLSDGTGPGAFTLSTLSFLENTCINVDYNQLHCIEDNIRLKHLAELAKLSHMFMTMLWYTSSGHLSLPRSNPNSTLLWSEEGGGYLHWLLT